VKDDDSIMRWIWMKFMEEGEHFLLRVGIGICKLIQDDHLPDDVNFEMMVLILKNINHIIS
jgi:hypothetical protein